MKLYLCANRFTKEQEETADKLVRALGEKGYVFAGDPSDCDLVVSLGGDGSMLKAAKYALAADKPLAGINSGRLGYLCALELSDVWNAGDPFSGLAVSERTVLETETDGRICLALNDVVFGKRYFGQTVEIEVLLNGKKAMDIRGDGLIAATPTGSTAYNKSAGGPVIARDADVLCLTPVCSSERPFVVSGKAIITVRLKRGDCDVFIDGEKAGEEKAEYVIRRSEKKLKLLR